ncbi:hypothetical protein BJY04DRAFT_187010 [Aspergillus karnatakaensis]|uniref:trypsin-like serine peptidase n=1 Tax=Aspergillus karnatakaensis TaxID=1810916 RepID=UPI003CCDE202
MPLLYNGNSRSSSNDIPVWDLKSSSPRPPDHVRNFPYYHGSHPQSQNVTERDERQRVNRREILPGGKYRGIAKLFLRYEHSERNTWATATGFLVQDDLVVTAGHCAYDWEYEMGELTEVKVYIGYTGKQTVDHPEVEFRHGKRVATTQEWMEKGGRRESDVAFIKLNKPFDEVTPLDFRDTPESDKGVIGVVGYPGDLEDNGEPGCQIYEAFVDAKWDLNRSQVLEYQVDAWGGFSGSPIFDQDDMDCIGIHTHGGARKNCGTAIGEYGAEFEPYFDALEARGERRRQPQRRGRAEEQDLVGEILKLVKDFPDQIPRDILSPDSNLSLGKIGVPAGAVAHIALSAATNAVTEDVRTSDGRFEKDRAFDSIAERALLAEAALQAVQDMSPQLRQSEHIFDTITKTVTNLLPTIQDAGSTVINAAQDPLLRLALDEVRNRNTRRTDVPSFRQSKNSRTNLNNKKASFVEALSEERDDRNQRFISNIACDGVSDDAEVNWDNLDLPRRLTSARSIMEGGKQQPSMVGPLLTSKGQQQGQQAQQIGLHNLQQLTEMGMEQDQFPLSVECLPLRAVVSESALQAILRIPQEELEQERLFDSMRDVIMEHGPTIMKIAPLVIRKVAPVFIAIASEGDFGRQYGREREYAKGYGKVYGGKYGGKAAAKYHLTTKTKSLSKGKPVSPAEQEFLVSF